MIAKCGGDGRENRLPTTQMSGKKNKISAKLYVHFKPCTLKGRLGPTRGDPDEDPGHGKLVVLILAGNLKRKF